jgi:hypothetical protein
MSRSYTHLAVLGLSGWLFPLVYRLGGKAAARWFVRAIDPVLVRCGL